MRVELRTALREPVGTLEIPRFQKAPVVLIWGVRVFHRVSTDGLTYDEVFSYVVPPNQIPEAGE